MKSTLKERYHTLIIGSGCAGYNAADRLYGLGIRDVAVITEGRTMGTSRNTGSDKQTYYKLSLCGDEGDSVRALARTLYEGGGVMGEHALCEAAYSTRCFMRLVELGVPFPTNAYGEFAGYKTDHDPRSRATSSGPLTSRYMTEALERSVMQKGIPILDGYRVVQLLVTENSVAGVAAVDTQTGEAVTIACDNVVLCTGGPASIYKSSVYPESQSGATGLAVEAGVTLSNLEEWQYGIASVAFRWNLSGTYQQVLPRYLSVDAEGVEREFLYDALKEDSLGLVFLKGYQWPFDTRKLDGSSKIDLLVAGEIKAGRRVYLDYRENPRGLTEDFMTVGDEAYTYLSRSGALFGRPIDRLMHMNPAAVALYRAHGIDLAAERLEISVCAQHCNGGVMVDEHWQTEITGLYCAGEAAGTFGVYRPGGSALNATQVGSLRAAEHIAKNKDRRSPPLPSFTLPEITYGESNLARLYAEYTAEMSRVADFDRSTDGMRALLSRVNDLYAHFFTTVVIRDEREIASLYRFYDTVLTLRAVLSAMICSAEEIGTHGASMVDRRPPSKSDTPRSTRTLTRGDRSEIAPVSSLPAPELWFETLLAAQTRKEENPHG